MKHDTTSAHILSGRTEPIGIIAGGGELPLHVRHAIKTAGREAVTVGIQGVCDTALKTDKVLGIAKFGGISKFLRRKGCKQIVIIGHIKRPNLLTLIPDTGGVRVMKRILMHQRRGDNVLLEEVIRFFSEEGFEPIAAHEILNEMLAPSGVLTQKKPDDVAQSDIAEGVDVTRMIGRLDIGQSCVVCRGQVLAVEGVDGTDALLSRIAVLDENLRGTVKKRQGVLVKLPKPNQEKRIDFPVLGKTTVENAAAAGLAGIAFEAQGLLINDLDACIALADKKGMFLFGLPASEDA